jgi:hypothetical protein
MSAASIVGTQPTYTLQWQAAVGKAVGTANLAKNYVTIALDLLISNGLLIAAGPNPFRVDPDGHRFKSGLP